MSLIKRVAETDINIDSYTVLRNKCVNLGSVDYHTAMALGLEACAVMGDLLQAKAWLNYTASELEREAKLKFAQLINVAPGSSQDKREAQVRVNQDYQDILIKAVNISALLGLVGDAYSHADKLHYFFRTIYSAETKTPTPNGLE